MKIFEITQVHKTVQDGNVFYTDDDGKLHRDDGPAVEYKDGTKEYWKHGKQYDSEFKNEKPHVKVTPVEGTPYKKIEITHPDGTVEYAIKYPTGMIEYRNKKGQIHRDGDKPAVIEPGGGKVWYKNGIRSRDNDLPAVEYPHAKYWYSPQGNRHRDNDLPAVEFTNGSKHWYQYGDLHREGKPAVIDSDGTIQYWERGRRVPAPGEKWPRNR